ncbi:hypothetical protein [Sodalis-like endosymbiont of Proechinophthirus fluctus]|uniref:hypothetical protein n=1 Tax=Sodalis-like endosymbiont of Proechinophthirus fluctus TaxID=1462730 RepID=UPI00164EF0E3|nr:hypothetical protein [Sodalis-like endosymbiont of Proechinophthirus fluctus]
MLSSSIGDHMTNLQYNDGTGREDDADNLLWHSDSDWLSMVLGQASRWKVCCGNASTSAAFSHCVVAAERRRIRSVT